MTDPSIDKVKLHYNTPPKPKPKTKPNNTNQTSRNTPELAERALEDEVRELRAAEVGLGALGQPELGFSQAAELLKIELVLQVP